MDTLRFYQTILPADGVKFLIRWRSLPDHPRGGYPIHHAFMDLEAMADKTREWVALGITVYHACAAFQEVRYRTLDSGRQIVVGRSADNALAVKALWVDLDVKPRDDAYATRKEAAQAISAFCRASGMPAPLVVSSGNGLHAYWVLAQAVPAAEWLPLAAAFRQALRQTGTKFDPSRDNDIASFLRPAGSVHLKDPTHPRRVEVLHEGRSLPAEQYRARLTRFTGMSTVAVATAPADSDLVTTPDYPPSSLGIVADHCAQLAHFRATGSETEPHWHAALGVAKHCFDGVELAHRWSATYVDYDAVECQSKLDRWSAGPTTCAQFKALEPSRCATCVHQVKSPIQLGYLAARETPAVSAPEPAAEIAEAAVDSPVIADIYPPLWPGNCRVHDGAITTAQRGEDGVVSWHRFAGPMFWPTERVRTEDGTYALRMRMEVRPGAFREFDLPLKHIVDPRSLRTALGAQEVFITHDKLAMAFLQDYAARMRQHKDEVNTFTQFGWTPDFQGFLIGDTLITQESTTRIRLGQRLAKFHDLSTAFQVNGSAAEWVSGVDTLYNRVNGEPYQYAICTAFGAVLAPLLEATEWNGIPLALTSGPSGRGKSTVCLIALNALCKGANVMVADTTAKGVPGRSSTMGSMPALFDEVTKSVKSGADMSDVLYALSNGCGRVGMTSDGQERAPLPRWKLMSFVTANRNVLFQLTESKVNPEAAQLRVFEIDLEAYPLLESMSDQSPLHGEHAALARRLLDGTHGVVAEEYIRYIMRHRERIRLKLRAVLGKVSAALAQRGGNGAKERFYAYHVTCTLVGAALAQQLGYLRFDLAALRQWAFQHVLQMRERARECAVTEHDKLSMFLSWLQGSILVTREYDQLGPKKQEVPLIPMRGPVKARLVLGSQKEVGKLYVAISAMTEWCHTHGYPVSEVRREWRNTGLIRVLPGGESSSQQYLSKGVPALAVGKARVMEIDFASVQGLADEMRAVTSSDNIVILDPSKKGAVA